MYTYLILKNPDHNAVYYNESVKLSISELKILSKKLDNTFKEISELNISEIKYLKFSKEDPINQNDMDLLSRLSFIFAIFEMKMIENKIEKMESRIKALEKQVAELEQRQ